MSDRVLLSVLTLAAVALIALATVWPQGYGARSLGPFGHTPIQQTPEMQAAMARAANKQKPKPSADPGAALSGLRPTQ